MFITSFEEQNITYRSCSNFLIHLSNHDSKDRKKLSGTLDKFSEKKILSVIRGEDGRYEITPIIRYVVNAEFLQSLLTEYEQLADKAAMHQCEQNKGKV